VLLLIRMQLIMLFKKLWRVDLSMVLVKGKFAHGESDDCINYKIQNQITKQPADVDPILLLLELASVKVTL